jgi:phosphoribosylaminoimidazolecarboxamide formyltransferase/IMP cyclohydrolase
MPHPVKRALISVSDKSGLIEFARALANLGIEIVSTGGTARTLAAAGLAVRDVSDLTGFPEIMEGRVKTLHPKVHGALLNKRGDAGHAAEKAAHDIGDIDLLVCNLYPFEATVRSGAPRDEVVENIDVGGPAMIRAAAKNHASVTVIVDASDYPQVLSDLGHNHGAVSDGLRRKLSGKAYARTAAYDAAIASWFAGDQQDPLPDYFAVGGRRLQTLRYGENPHQQAALYASSDARAGIGQARQLQGKELSYNNINDADAALDCVQEFDAAEAAACVIVKHANPCGVALAASPLRAYLKALACDPVSAFGGILAFNRPLTADVAEEISKLFTEVILAPGADEDALNILAAKKNLRVLITDAGRTSRSMSMQVKTIIGGLLVQSHDDVSFDESSLRVVSRRAPGDAEWRDLRFAFRVAKHVKSNAIVYARELATVGIGAGQMSRVDSARIAVRKSEDAARAAGLSETSVKGSVVASDAFFPFADGLMQAAEAGATAVIQPGGSMRDDEVIKAADAAGLAMVFTGIRHFRH